MKWKISKRLDGKWVARYTDGLFSPSYCISDDWHRCVRFVNQAIIFERKLTTGKW